MSDQPAHIDPATGTPFPERGTITEGEVFQATAFGSGLDQDGEAYLVFESREGKRIFIRILNERFINSMLKNLEDMRQRMYHVDHNQRSEDGGQGPDNRPPTSDF